MGMRPRDAQETLLLQWEGWAWCRWREQLEDAKAHGSKRMPRSQGADSKEQKRSAFKACARCLLFQENLPDVWLDNCSVPY